MLRRDFALAALAAPFAGILRGKPKGDRRSAIMLDDAASGPELPSRLSGVRVVVGTPQKTDTPLWHSMDEMMEFFCAVINLSSYHQQGVHTDILHRNHQHDVIDLQAKYGEHVVREGIGSDDKHDLKFRTPEDAAREIERRYLSVIQNLRAKVLGFKETT